MLCSLNYALLVLSLTYVNLSRIMHACLDSDSVHMYYHKMDAKIPVGANHPRLTMLICALLHADQGSLGNKIETVSKFV